jgi:hypothetical protein
MRDHFFNYLQTSIGSLASSVSKMSLAGIAASLRTLADELESQSRVLECDRPGYVKSQLRVLHPRFTTPGFRPRGRLFATDKSAESFQIRSFKIRGSP